MAGSDFATPVRLSVSGPQPENRQREILISLQLTVNIIATAASRRTLDASFLQLYNPKICYTKEIIKY